MAIRKSRNLVFIVLLTDMMQSGAINVVRINKQYRYAIHPNFIINETY